MSNRCPVCKARLWTDPLLAPGPLSCPRCGAVFRPTVSWGYFRILLLLVVVLSLVVIAFMSQTNLWVLLFLMGVTVFFWFLPRFIDLQRISAELGLPEGPLDADQLKLKLEDEQWKEKREAFEEESRFRQVVYFLIAVVLLMLLLVSLGRGS